MHREIVTLSDGGEVALDWANLPSESHKSFHSNKNSSVQNNMPILLILPGITGMTVSD